MEIKELFFEIKEYLLKIVHSNSKLEKIARKKIELGDFEGAIKTASKISPYDRWTILCETEQAALKNKKFNLALKAVNLKHRNNETSFSKIQDVDKIIRAALKAGDFKFAMEQATSMRIRLEIAEATGALPDIEKIREEANSMSHWDVKEQATILEKLAEIAAKAGYFDLAWNIACRDIVLDHGGENISKKARAMRFVIEKAALAKNLDFAHKWGVKMSEYVKHSKEILNKCYVESDAYWDAKMDLNSWASSAIGAWLAISRASKLPDDLKTARDLIIENLDDEQRKEKESELEKIEKSI